MGSIKKRGAFARISPSSMITGIALIAGAIFLFGFWNKVQKLFGFGEGSDANVVKDVVSNVTTKSPWHPDFWRTVPQASLYTTADSKKLLDKLFSYFGKFNDDESAIYAWFRSLHSQTGLSWLIYQYRINTGKDFLTEIQGSAWYLDRGLNDSEFAKVISIVNALPLKKK